MQNCRNYYYVRNNELTDFMNSSMDNNTKQTYEDSNQENKKNETNKEYEVDFINHPQTIRESDSNHKSNQNK